MNFRLTLVLTIILLAIGAIVFYAERNGSDAKPAPKEEHLLLGQEPKALKSVSLSRDNKTVVAFQQTGDKWAMTAPMQTSVEAWKVQSPVDGLRILTYRDKFMPESSGTKSLEATGVDTPSAVIKFSDDAGNEHTLAMGKSTPVGTRYVKIDKDANIYEVKSDWFDQLDKDPSEFRSKDILNIATDNIVSISLTRPDQTVQINHIDGKWTITQPVITRANSSALDDMAAALTDLRTDSFTDITPESAGLKPPLFTVTIQAREKTDAPAATQPATQPVITPSTISFGNYADLARKTAYATVSGSNEVFVVNADVLKKFDKTLFTVRDAAITPANVDAATTVEIATTNHSVYPDAPSDYILTQMNGSWTLSTPNVPADSSTVINILASIKNLRANKFVDAPGDLKSIGLNPPDKTITLTLPGQTQRETILIGHPQKDEPLTPVQRQGEPTVYLVQTPDLAALSPSPLTLRDKVVKKFPTESIQSIMVTGPAISAPLKFEHVGTSWTINGKPADESKVSSLLADVNPLTAQRWTAMNPYITAPDLRMHIVTQETETPTTKPSTLPAMDNGPMPKHEVHHEVLLFRVKDKDKISWLGVAATPANLSTDWTFEPSAILIDHLTKTSYEAPPATAPATSTAPATLP